MPTRRASRRGHSTPFAKAQQRTPTEWSLYLLEAKVLEEIDPVSARRSLADARRLNPQGDEIAALEARLGE